MIRVDHDERKPDMGLRFFLYVSSEGRRSILGPFTSMSDAADILRSDGNGTLHSAYAETWGEANQIFNREEFANENLR
jgi:hypothetical protein